MEGQKSCVERTTWELCFKDVPQFCKMVCQSNEGSVAKFSYCNTDDAFESMTLSFDGAIKGFHAWCRSAIGLDACHLYGMHVTYKKGYLKQFQLCSQANLTNSVGVGGRGKIDMDPPIKGKRAGMPSIKRKGHRMNHNQTPKFISVVYVVQLNTTNQDVHVVTLARILKGRDQELKLILLHSPYLMHLHLQRIKLRRRVQTVRKNHRNKLRIRVHLQLHLLLKLLELQISRK